jgi:hypothetical protein
MLRAARAAILLFVSVSLISSCTDIYDPGAGQPGQPGHPAPPPPPPPVLRAGAISAVVVLPADSAPLTGWLHVPAPADIESFAWAWVGGPASFSLANSGSLVARLTDLEPGVYEFELTARTMSGQVSRDTATILAYDPRVAPTEEIVRTGLQWQCPMGCWLDLGRARQYTGNGGGLRIHVQQDESRWVEAIPEHEWTGPLGDGVAWLLLGGGHLWLYRNDDGGPATVRVMY